MDIVRSGKTGKAGRHESAGVGASVCTLVRVLLLTVWLKALGQLTAAAKTVRNKKSGKPVG
jgi:hypothetical protein